ncbi:MAG TPA: GNAT family N-acetyltransferase [Candidatus Nitrosopolaris sp.]|nr:GNAT family N-acetyltransferase [Candidatus Nitrosopolaris sp.]
MIRPIEQNDAESCGKIGYEAHKSISSAHGYPSEQPSEEFGIGLIRRLLGNPNSWGVLAERQGKTLGSIFLHKFPPSPVAVIGPLTVHPSAEGGVGKMLMDAALTQARKQNYDQIRLVQSPSHIRSFVLYTKSGFALREPLFLMQGQPLKGENNASSANVLLVGDENDVSVCNEFCKSVYGFSREMELRQAKDQGFATMLERDGVITGYAAGIGIFGHAVAKTNEDLKTLIANASAILGPGFFAPARNHELINWLLSNGFQIGWPANLMTVGPYQEPLTPFLPSLAY